MSRLVRSLKSVVLVVSACGEAGPAAAPDGSAIAVDASVDAGLDWTNGGADLPEYSLGRLLISHLDAPSLTLFDLDTHATAGHIPLAARAEVEAGGTGRYGYAYSPEQGVLHVIDPGQWLLSHIDHFHVMRGEHRLRQEQASVPMLSSLLAHDGWITAYAAGSGSALYFQERSITAQSFAPSVTSLATPIGDGVALVSRAQLVASDGPELSQRSVFDGSSALARFAGCSDPRGIAAQGERTFIGCAEGLLQLTWMAAEELFAPELLATDQRVNVVRTTERFDGALLQLGASTLGLLGARGTAVRSVNLNSDIVAYDLRRQGNFAIVLTADGAAHELDLEGATITRTKTALAPAATGARLALSHAYGYITDPHAARVHILRLRTMQFESEIVLSSPAYDVALVGVPSGYTDDRE